MYYSDKINNVCLMSSAQSACVALRYGSRAKNYMDDCLANLMLIELMN